MFKKRIFLVSVVVLCVACAGYADKICDDDPTAAMVVNDVNLPAGFDQAQKDRLESLGYTVTVVSGADVSDGVFTAADAETYDVLVVSESIGSSQANNLIGANVPMMHQESYGWSRHYFTFGLGKTWLNDPAGEINIVDDTHPIIANAGLAAGQVAFYTDPSIAWTTDTVESLVAGAENLAQIANADGVAHTIIYAIEAGTELADPNMVAANRVCGFSLPGQSLLTADFMTDDAWALFDSAIAWLSPWPNHCPVAYADIDMVIEQDSHDGGLVVLNGAASYDPDGDPLTYTWTWGDASMATGDVLTAVMPLGTTTVTLVVNDGIADSEPDTVDFTIVDTTDPVINSVSADPCELSPAPCEMVAVTVSVDATDICDPAPICYITCVDVTCSCCCPCPKPEPKPKPDCDDKTKPEKDLVKSYLKCVPEPEPEPEPCPKPCPEPDWELTEDPLVVLLRACGGCVYTINVVCEDGSGNTATGSVEVTVPCPCCVSK
jgi:hypothetical protein